MSNFEIAVAAKLIRSLKLIISGYTWVKIIITRLRLVKQLPTLSSFIIMFRPLMSTLDHVIIVVMSR